MIISYADGVGYSVTRPSQKIFDLVLELDWADKLQLFRNPEPKRTSAGNSDGEGSADGEGKKKSSTRKYVCPKCGLNIRATKEVRIACIDCGNIPMKPVITNERDERYPT